MWLVLLIALAAPQDKIRQKYEEKRLEAPQTAKGQFDLGKWCERSKLREEAIKAYERAVEIDPGFEAARKALGQKRVLGRWVSEKNYDDPSWWAHSKVPQKKVDDAILKAGEFLLAQLGRLPSITHTFGSHRLRMDEFVLLTLLEAGWDRNDPRIKGLIQRILTLPLDKVYHVSIRAMCLAALDPLKYQQQLAQCAQFLVDNQHSNGGWGYGREVPLPASFPGSDKGPVRDIETGADAGPKPATRVRQIEVKRGPGQGDDNTDNSNAQYAALGIRACLSGLVVVPKEVVERAEKYWEQNQKSDGGWAYSGTGGNRVPDDKSYGSMTAGGVGSLVIFKYYRHRVWGDTVDWKNDASVQRGVAWMGKELDFTKNPQAPYNVWQYYWFYATERAGRLLETESFGGKEWYPAGVDPILSRQQSDGSFAEEKWDVPGGALSAKSVLAPGVVTETCFSILFLRRATPKTDETIKIQTGSASK